MKHVLLTIASLVLLAGCVGDPFEAAAIGATAGAAGQAGAAGATAGAAGASGSAGATAGAAGASGSSAGASGSAGATAGAAGASGASAGASGSAGATAGAAGASGASAGASGSAGATAGAAGASGSSAGASGSAGATAGAAGASAGAAGASAGAAGTAGGAGQAGAAGGAAGAGGATVPCGPGYVCTFGTATSSTTGLIWTRDSLGPEPYDQAHADCAAQGPLWRLPSADELATLVTSGKPSIDLVTFPDTKNARYWTANGSTSGRVTLDFGADGAPATTPVATPAYARCVRAPG